ncbi:hypothetical protein Tco_1036988, partial [Tanacetum coccineum]
GCSKHMNGNLKLLRIYVEKFMGIVNFANDNFDATTGYGDYPKAISQFVTCTTLRVSDITFSRSDSVAMEILKGLSF